MFLGFIDSPNTFFDGGMGYRNSGDGKEELDSDDDEEEDDECHGDE